MLNGKNILITGGTGSLGKKMTHIILENYTPEKLIIFSRDELKQFEMSQRWSMKKYPCIRYFLGDVRDKDRLVRGLMALIILSMRQRLNRFLQQNIIPQNSSKRTFWVQ